MSTTESCACGASTVSASGSRVYDEANVRDFRVAHAACREPRPEARPDPLDAAHAVALEREKIAAFVESHTLVPATGITAFCAAAIGATPKQVMDWSIADLAQAIRSGAHNGEGA